MTNLTISENLARVRAQITDAAIAAGRKPESVGLIAVSKTKPADMVVAALNEGQHDFGENYVQEALGKMRDVSRLAPDLAPVWHYIGAIQSNKTRDLARHFQWIHTVDRTKIARRLNDACADGKSLDICLQINVDADPNKAGSTPDSAAALLAECLGFENLRIRGLMTILDPRTDPEEGYNRLRILFEDLAGAATPHWDTLSMGMSGDYPAAIAAGATRVRVGSAIFGQRTATAERQE